MRLPDGEEADVWLPLLGRQNVANALAAAAAAQAVGASTDDIVAGPRARGAGARPAACRCPGAAARRSSTTATTRIRVRCTRRSTTSRRSSGRRILVFGNMAELGPDGAGAAPRDRRVRARPLRSPVRRSASSRAKRRRRSARTARAFADIEAARARRSIRCSRPNVTVLVKGSRVMGLDRLVQGARGRGAESDVRC